MTDFLIEIGTEELPPKALKSLIKAFEQGVLDGLAGARLDCDGVVPFASPRRLALLIENLSDRQPDQTVTVKGPPVKVAFDDRGAAKPAAEAFAKKCGVSVDALARESTPKGEWLTFEKHEAGEPMLSLIGPLIEKALLDMPIPRRMRWGDSPIEFVRPVHWVLALYGKDTADIEILGVRAGNVTRGHRFMSDGPITIGSPDEYEKVLKDQGRVIASLEKRRARVVDGVEAAADAAGGIAIGSDALYDEVTALVEWPVAVTGAFEQRFLTLPREIITATLSGHQRYFSIEGADGSLLPEFITISNIDSSDPSKVSDGNERVVRPRLADAEFFWQTDLATTLEDRREKLGAVIYQQGLGTIADKVERTVAIADRLAAAVGVDGSTVRRAASLCKSDLVTGMVGEFPELQGVVGRYYAIENGESADVAIAIEEHYLPRHASDVLPESRAGRVLAVADRLDTLAGLFVAGKKPSGNRDPFGLRRAALAIIRILIERGLDLDLDEAVEHAISLQPTPAKGDAHDELMQFFKDRLRGYATDRDHSVEAFESVSVGTLTSLVDFERRLDAVSRFSDLDDADSLSAANKRIANILKKAETDESRAVDASLLNDDAEKALYTEVQSTAADVEPLLNAREYSAALTRMAALRPSVDAFFDDVMVMADDDAIRTNRLALLSELRGMFLKVADISRLSTG